MTTYTPPSFADGVSRDAVSFNPTTLGQLRNMTTEEVAAALGAQMQQTPLPTTPPKNSSKASKPSYWRELLRLQPPWRTATGYRLMALHMELAADGPTYKHTARRKAG